MLTCIFIRTQVVAFLQWIEFRLARVELKEIRNLKAIKVEDKKFVKKLFLIVKEDCITMCFLESKNLEQ